MTTFLREILTIFTPFLNTN